MKGMSCTDPWMGGVGGGALEAAPLPANPLALSKPAISGLADLIKRPHTSVEMKCTSCTDPWMGGVGGGAPEASLGPDMEGLGARAEPLLLAGQVQRQATLLLHIFIGEKKKLKVNQ
jgi:hypothetical protein